MRNVVDPVEKPGVHGGKLDDLAYTHDAFGQISASRVSGSGVLYGSDFVHQHFVTISIHRSELHRDLSHDWHFPREELIEVCLTEAQWATFVSSMNNGSGVPCTLWRVAGKSMPDLPVRKIANVAKAELHRTLERAESLIDTAIQSVEGEMKGLSQVKRERITATLVQLKRDVGDSLPYMAKSFEKHMETTVEKAKIEVGAYMTSAVQRAGLAALGASAQPLLMGGDDAPQA